MSSSSWPLQTVPAGSDSRLVCKASHIRGKTHYEGHTQPAAFMCEISNKSCCRHCIADFCGLIRPPIHLSVPFREAACCHVNRGGWQLHVWWEGIASTEYLLLVFTHPMFDSQQQTIQCLPMLKVYEYADYCWVILLTDTSTPLAGTARPTPFENKNVYTPCLHCCHMCFVSAQILAYWASFM